MSRPSGAAAGAPAISREQIDMLSELNIIKLRSDALEGLVRQMTQTRAAVEEQEETVVQLKREAQLLAAEEEMHLEQLAKIRKDKENVDAAIATAIAQREALQQQVAANQSRHYNELKASVEDLREKHGLARLPTLEEVEEQGTRGYLERRRQKWRVAGVSTL